MAVVMSLPLRPASGRIPQRGDADQTWKVQNERDGAVAENRGARDAIDLSIIGLERFDDDLLLAEQLIDEQAETAALALDDDDESLVQLACARLDAEEFVQANDGQVAAAEREHFTAAAEPIHLRALQLQRLDDRGEGHDVGLAADRHRLAIDDGERQRQGDHEARSAPGVAAYLDFAAELLDIAPDHVHPDSAAGDIGRAVGGGKARHEDEIVDLRVAQGVGRTDQSALARFAQDPGAVEPAAVIAHFDRDVAAAMARIKMNRACHGFAGRTAHIGLFDSMVDAVAHEVNERIADLLEDGLVEFGVLAGDLELDLLAESLRQIAHHAWEAAEYETDRQHAHAHDAFLQLAHVALELVEAGAEAVRGGSLEDAAKLAQHRLRDDELAHGVHELVDLLDAHANGSRVADATDTGRVRLGWRRGRNRVRWRTLSGGRRHDVRVLHGR